MAVLTDDSMLAIYNGDGEPVWWWAVGDEGLVSQAKMKDGKIWFDQFSRESDSPDLLHTLSLDLSADIQEELPDSHHDFILFDDRTVYLARDRRDGPDGQPWIGDKLMQRLEDGTTTELWSTWGSVSTEVVADTFYRDGRDWIHSNGLAYWPERDLYLVSSKTQQAVFAVDGAGGGLQWVMGGVQNTLEWVDGDPFGAVHGPLYTDGRLWIFNNGDGKAPSAAEAYTLDPDKQRCTKVWEYQDSKRSTMIHGNVLPLPDGTILAAWGDEGTVKWLEESGTVLGDWQGGSPGYVQWLPSLGGPLP